MFSSALNVFWIGILVVLYTYVGYGIFIYLFSKIAGHRARFTVKSDEELPHISLLIAAYNEEQFITDKIQNTLALDYPSNRLDIVFVTDGSSDRTPDLVRNFPGIQLYHQPERRGKIHAVNRVMEFIRTPFVIFCDANTLLNREALKNIVRHYQDPKVGGVAGEKRIFSQTADNASGAGEGLYWKYESFLKRKDAEVYSIVGAAGELFSIRTDLYEEPAENMIIEDFYISMRIAGRGFRFAYEPDAYAMETASASVAEEWKRKVRICAGAFQAMGKLLYLLNPFRYGILSFQYFSHRVLRWTLAPLALPLVFISSAFLALRGLPFYQLALGCQIGFYGLAFAGYKLRDKKITIKGFFVPYYFIVMNLAVYAGLSRFLRGKQSVTWEKAKRAETQITP